MYYVFYMNIIQKHVVPQKMERDVNFEKFKSQGGRGMKGACPHGRMAVIMVIKKGGNLGQNNFII